MTRQGQQTDLEKLIEAMTEGRELVRELHTAVRDARQTMKEWRKVRQDVLSSDELSERLDKATSDAVQQFMTEMTSQVKRATDAVNDRFDTIMMICMGEDPQSVREGRRTTIELIKEFIESKKIPIKITEEIYLLISRRTKDYEESSPGIIARGGLSSLPIMVDDRVPFMQAFLVIPEIGDHKPQLVEINIRTGEGCAKGAELINEYGRERARVIPAAFDRKRTEGLDSA